MEKEYDRQGIADVFTQFYEHLCREVHSIAAADHHNREEQLQRIPTFTRKDLEVALRALKSGKAAELKVKRYRCRDAQSRR